MKVPGKTIFSDFDQGSQDLFCPIYHSTEAISAQGPAAPEASVQAERCKAAWSVVHFVTRRRKETIG